MRLLVAGRGNERKYRSWEGDLSRRNRGCAIAVGRGDIFILPTVYDPFSNASLEAMAAGLPVITTRANGCSEIIEPKVHGSVVDRPDDVKALSDALHF